MVARPPVRARRPRPSRGRLAARRLGALGLLLAALGVGVWLATGAIGGNEKSASTTTVDVRPLRIVFPEGFTRAQMAQRITAVDRIARRKRHVNPRLAARTYLAVTRSSKLPGRFAGDGERRTLEGFLFPALYDFTAQTTSGQLVKDQLVAFRRNFGRLNLAYAKSKNLTPYDILIIASMVEEEVIAPNERALVAAVIYNRLHNRMPLQIDATTRYGLKIPPGARDHGRGAGQPEPLQHSQQAGAAADADLEPGPRVDASRGPPRKGRLPVLRPQARQGPSLLHVEPRRLQRVRRGAPGQRGLISGETRLVGLIGEPVAAPCRPRCRTPRSPPAASTGHTSRFRWRRTSWRTRFAASLALGFAGANVTAPYKLVVAGLVGAAERSVNTLVVRGGRIEASSTDAAVLAGRSPERPVVLGGGGAAAAFVRALPGARQFSRSGDWPADAAAADLVVNATSERDEVLVKLGPGQTLVDLPYPETATARAARERGRRGDLRAGACWWLRERPRSSSGPACRRPSK